MGKMRPEPETAVRKWKKKVEDECGDIPMVLVQNKIDLVSQSEIDQ
jgi:Ras-related protein Rab-23